MYWYYNGEKLLLLFWIQIQFECFTMTLLETLPKSEISENSLQVEIPSSSRTWTLFYQLDSRNYGKSIHKMASGVTGQSLLSCFSFVFGRASQCCLDEWIYGNSSCNKNALFNKEHPTQRKNMVYFYFTWNRVSSDISGVIRVNGDGNHSWLQLHKSYPIQTITSEWYKASQQQQTT